MKQELKQSQEKSPQHMVNEQMINQDEEVLNQETTNQSSTNQSITNQDGENQENQKHIGSFAAYCRRPVPQKKGYMSQFFGEDGEDADTITALGLTRYVDKMIEIIVFIIKDKNGKIMKQNDEYPVACHFIGYIKRPKSTTTGMIAQIFAENGPDADNVLELGKTDLQDSLVYVTINEPDEAIEQRSESEQKQYDNFIYSVLNQGKNENKNLDQNELGSKQKPQLDSIVDSETIQEQTKKPGFNEKKQYKKKEKMLIEFDRELTLSGFFRDQRVLHTIGTEQGYKQWLEKQTCCWPCKNKEDVCQEKDIVAEKIPNAPDNKFHFVPLCQYHAELIRNNQSGLQQNGASFLKTRQMHYVQKWARQTILDKIGLKNDDYIVPDKFLDLMTELSLQNSVPQKLKGYLLEDM